MVGFGVGLGDVSEVCANDGNATRVAVTTAMSELGKVFIRSHSFRDRLAASSRTSLERRPQKPKMESEKAENRKQWSLPDSELAQLGCGEKSPIAICCGAGRTRMQN